MIAEPEPNKEKLKQMAVALVAEFGAGNWIQNRTAKEVDNRVSEEHAKAILKWMHDNLKEYCGT